MESTSLVLAYGSDIYGTRATPSQAFDVLGKSFSKLQLVLTVVALGAGVTVLAPMVCFTLFEFPSVISAFTNAILSFRLGENKSMPCGRLRSQWKCDGKEWVPPDIYHKRNQGNQEMCIIEVNAIADIPLKGETIATVLILSVVHVVSDPGSKISVDQECDDECQGNASRAYTCFITYIALYCQLPNHFH